jgi:hypothetical protein
MGIRLTAERALRFRTIPESHFEEEDSGLDRSSNYDKTGGIDHVLSLNPESG